MKKISIIGAGTMGNGIAQVFAMNNCHVNLIDLNSSSLTNGVNRIITNLDRMIKRDIISSDQKTATLDNISTSIVLGNIFFDKLKCCFANISVGAINAT